MFSFLKNLQIVKSDTIKLSKEKRAKTLIYKYLIPVENLVF
jgi:hypothetical protein